MLSDLQKRKLTRMFDHIDGDRDGVLVRGDYDRICESLLGVLGASPGSPEGAEIVASYAVEWDELQPDADADADTDGGRRVTRALWLGYRDRQLAGPDAFEVMIDPYVGTVFALLDADHDGRISTDEVRRYLGLYRMGEGEVDEILRKIDPERRGSFTRREIGQLSRDFYFSSDEGAPGSWLLGRF
jgi:Ca2+-binding EF-hand superfamily protein